MLAGLLASRVLRTIIATAKSLQEAFGISSENSITTITKEDALDIADEVALPQLPTLVAVELKKEKHITYVEFCISMLLQKNNALYFCIIICYD